MATAGIFSMTYLCESGFSAQVYINITCENGLDSQHNIQLAPSRKRPRFANIENNSQVTKSHVTTNDHGSYGCDLCHNILLG